MGGAFAGGAAAATAWGGVVWGEAAGACGMERVALELADLGGLFVDIGQEAAGGFAVEAGGGNQAVVTLRLLRGPLVRIDFDDIIPRLGARMAAERAIG